MDMDLNNRLTEDETLEPVSYTHLRNNTLYTMSLLTPYITGSFLCGIKNDILLRT